MICHLYLGGYGPAIAHFLLDTARPMLRPLRTYPADRPSWLTAAGETLWAVSERDEGGAVSSWHIRRDGALQPLGSLELPGAALCHLTALPGGHLACAGYGSGSLLTVSTREGGAPDWMTALVRHRGHGPNPDRQEAPHVHSTALHPDGVRLFTADLGLDRVFCYALSPDGGLTPMPEEDIAFPPGSGPRHLALTADGQTLLAVTELSNRVLVFRNTGGGWAQTDDAAVLPEGCAEETLSAAIRLSADEKRVYVTARGADLAVIFGLEAGRLTRLASLPSGGHWPRDLILSPDGRCMLIANQLSGTVALFPLGEDGLPSDGPLTAECADVSSLVCVPAAKKSGQ